MHDNNFIQQRNRSVEQKLALADNSIVKTKVRAQ